MLVGLALVVIVALIAVPSFKQLLDQQADRLLQTQFLDAIQFARQTAEAQRAPIALRWDTRLIVYEDTYRDGTLRDSKQIRQANQLALQGVVRWRSFPHYHTYPCFMPLAHMTADNGTFWYCHFHHAYPEWAISVNKMGSIRVLGQSEIKNISCH